MLLDVILYLIPLIICLSGSIEYDINEKKLKSSFWWYFLFSYMTLFMGLRYGVGGDTINYMGDYEYIPDLRNYTFISLNRFDPGFNFLMSAGKSISDEFIGFQFLHILILNTLIFYILNQYTKYKYSTFLCALFTFYYYFATEILRESIAVLIFVINYKNLVDKKWIKYYLLVLVSILFHKSASFLLILPFITWIKFNLKYLFICILTLIACAFLKPIFNLLSQIDSISNGINNYRDEISHGLLADSILLSRQFIFPLLFLIYAKFGLHRFKLKYESMICIMTLLGLMAFFNPIIFGRLCNYFIVFFVLDFTRMILYSIKLRKLATRNSCIIILTSFFILYGSSFLMYRNYQLYLPYYSVFNPKNVDRDIFAK